jgi:hypothetical protein
MKFSKSPNFYYVWSKTLVKFLFKSHHLKNFDLYRTEVGDRFSMQKVKGDQDSDQSDRLAGNSVYAYLYPNMMINRYGSWMDTNIVVPKGTGVEILKEK